MNNLVLCTVYLLFIGFHATALHASSKPTNDKLRISAFSLTCVHLAIWSALAYGRWHTGDTVTRKFTVIDITVWLLVTVADVLVILSTCKPYVDRKSAKQLRLAAIAFQAISILVVAGLTWLYVEGDIRNALRNLNDRIKT